MIGFIADENFDNRILWGIQRQLSEFDVIRVQDTSFYQAPDPDLLAWAADMGRVLLTQDQKTMPKYVYERIHRHQIVIGVIIVPKTLAVGLAISDLLIVITVNQPEDYTNQIIYLPL